MYPFKIVITTVKMTKSKLHTTLTLAGEKRLFISALRGPVIFFIFLLSPWEVEGALGNAHWPSDKVETVMEPAWQVQVCTVPLRPDVAASVCFEDNIRDKQFFLLRVFYNELKALMHFLPCASKWRASVNSRECWRDVSNALIYLSYPLKLLFVLFWL